MSAYVLLVEDNYLNANIVSRILQSHGFSVRHAATGADSARIARAERPALILMDFDLPDVDGRDMVRLLQVQLGGADAPPIIAVTARVSEAEQRIAYDLGCAAFIGKPFSADELLRVVQGFITAE